MNTVTSRIEGEVEERTGARGRDLGRIIGLSDGVFAFALTLLASGIGVPDFNRDISQALFTQEILTLVPQFLIYAVVFSVIIFKWMVHRRMFAVVVAYDTRLIWFNNLLLLMIAFMPVPSKILVEYPQQVAAVVFFAVAHVLTTLSQQGLWNYITATPALVRSDIDQAYLRQSKHDNWSVIAVALLSIVIAIWVSPAFAVVSWILSPMVSAWRARRRVK